LLSHLTDMNTSYDSSKGFTLIELVIVAGIIGLISAVAVPGLLRARMTGNEASAVGSLRAINSGQAAYSSSCAGGAYAVTLDDLVKVPSGAQEGFVSRDLSSNGVTKSGYAVALAPDAAPGTTTLSGLPTCNGSATSPASAYFAQADPAVIGVAGGRHFATDTRGTIFWDGSTIANPITVTTTVQ
jgi:prepilin-type N-terminal cleavage/methylation domain-containing protein